MLQDEIPARDASDEELLRVHTAEYLALVGRETSASIAPHYLSTGDAAIDARSLVAARRAAGGALAAMEAALESDAPVFALIRPPGHHAEPDRGMGFCLFNNVAVAARAFLAVHGKRVLIVDFDYHHGNGTQAVAGKGISYVGTHAAPAYPGTGGVEPNETRRGEDVIANVPLSVGGVSTERFISTWDALLPRVAALVRPELILVSAGFDYVAGDPVGDLGVGVEAASALGECIAAVAEEYCKRRVAYVLEGGYDLDVLTESITRIVRASDSSP